MKQKLEFVLGKLKLIGGAASRLYQLSPFAAGVALGYFGHGPIHLAGNAAFALAKALLKL